MGSDTRQIRNPSPDQVLIAIITGAANFREILNQLPVLAESDLPVLLRGEPGTVKELVARAICALNHRRQLCQVINCASLTESLVRGFYESQAQSHFADFAIKNGV